MACVTVAMLVASGILDVGLPATRPVAPGSPAVDVRTPIVEPSPSPATRTAPPTSTNPPAAALPSIVQPHVAVSVWHVPILKYHHVRPAAAIPATERTPGYYLDPALLAAQLAALRRAGWTSITCGELAAAITMGVPVPARSVVLTFDDGALDNYTYAYPILERYGFRATFFVVPRTIGHRPGNMTPDQLRDLVAHGDEIGNHTFAHADLSLATYPAAQAEIHRAGDAILAMTGTRPRTLAYPFGRYDDIAMRAAAAEGIELAVTTRRGASESWPARLHAPRVSVFGYHRTTTGTLAGGMSASQLLATLARLVPPVRTVVALRENANRPAAAPPSLLRPD